MRLGLELDTIVHMVKGQTTLNHSFLVNKIASLEHAGPDDIAVVIDRGDASVFDSVAKEQIENCKAGVILARKALAENKNFLVVDEPLQAYTLLVQAALNKSEQVKLNQDYPHAYVSVDAVLGESVSVGMGAVVKSGAQIGDGSVIGDGCYVGHDVQIGKSVHLQPGVSILERCVVGDQSFIQAHSVVGSDGFGYQVTKTGMFKIPHIGIVELGSHVEIGANCSIDRAAFGKTKLGNGVKIDNNVHIAHGVEVGDHSAILAHTSIGGSVTIGFGCQIGGQVAIKDHVTIGDGAKIVSKSAVHRDVEPKAVVGGMPAIDFKQWKRIIICTLKLPEIVKKASKIERQFKIRQEKSWWQRLFL